MNRPNLDDYRIAEIARGSDLLKIKYVKYCIDLEKYCDEVEEENDKLKEDLENYKKALNDACVDLSEYTYLHCENHCGGGCYNEDKSECGDGCFFKYRQTEEEWKNQLLGKTIKE